MCEHAFSYRGDDDYFMHPLLSVISSFIQQVRVLVKSIPREQPNQIFISENRFY